MLLVEGCNYSVISVLDLLVAVIPVTLFSTKEEVCFDAKC